MAGSHGVRLQHSAAVVSYLSAKPDVVVDRHRLLLVGEDEDASGVSRRLQQRLDVLRRKVLRQIYIGQLRAKCIVGRLDRPAVELIDDACGPLVVRLDEWSSPCQQP